MFQILWGETSDTLLYIIRKPIIQFVLHRTNMYIWYVLIWWFYAACDITDFTCTKIKTHALKLSYSLMLTFIHSLSQSSPYFYSKINKMCYEAKWTIFSISLTLLWQCSLLYCIVYIQIYPTQPLWRLINKQ